MFSRFSSDERSDIFVVAADGSGERQITDIPPIDVSQAMYPDWSPDGSRIAFSCTKISEVPAIRRSSIYTVAPDGSNLVEVVPPERLYTAPLWSADGEQLVFQRPIQASRDLPGPEVYVVESPTVPSDPIRVAGGDYSFPSTPSWSPNDDVIALSLTPVSPPDLYDGGTRGIHIIDMRTLEKVQVIRFGDSPSWSSDGRFIAFSFGMNPGAIGVTDVSGETQWLVTDNGDYPQWRPSPPR